MLTERVVLSEHVEPAAAGAALGFGALKQSRALYTLLHVALATPLRRSMRGLLAAPRLASLPPEVLTVVMRYLPGRDLARHR